ncbi:MAG: hypothetical protein ACFE7E_06365 [Candidatus Hodarchaeota archaeon]
MDGGMWIEDFAAAGGEEGVKGEEGPKWQTRRRIQYGFNSFEHLSGVFYLVLINDY